MRAAVALGSNLGNRRRWLTLALDLLDLPVLAVSCLYDTAPVGDVPQGRFLNAVAVIDTPPDPVGLLARMLAVERACGRRRLIAKGPRTVDLDLLLTDQPLPESPYLRLPHPEIGQRAFVLVPLLEVWPAEAIPVPREVIERCLSDDPSLAVAAQEDWYPRISPS